MSSPETAEMKGVETQNVVDIPAWQEDAVHRIHSLHRVSER
jgi:hypothetical protein